MRRIYRYDHDRKGMVQIHGPGKTSIQKAAVMGDCYHTNPVVSPVDGTLLDSRQKVREHNARNAVVDVGNDKAFTRPREPSVPSQREVERDVKTLYERFSQNDAEAHRMARSDRELNGSVHIYE